MGVDMKFFFQNNISHQSLGKTDAVIDSDNESQSSNTNFKVRQNNEPGKAASLTNIFSWIRSGASKLLCFAPSQTPRRASQVDEELGELRSQNREEVLNFLHEQGFKREKLDPIADNRLHEFVRTVKYMAELERAGFNKDDLQHFTHRWPGGSLNILNDGLKTLSEVSADYAMGSYEQSILALFGPNLVRQLSCASANLDHEGVGTSIQSIMINRVAPQVLRAFVKDVAETLPATVITEVRDFHLQKYKSELDQKISSCVKASEEMMRKAWKETNTVDWGNLLLDLDKIENKLGEEEQSLPQVGDAQAQDTSQPEDTKQARILHL